MTFDLNTATIDDEQEQKKKQNQGFNINSATFEDAETPENNNAQVGSVEYNDYARKHGEIYNAPRENLLDKIGKVLNWITQTPLKAYSQGDKNVEAAELNAKEIFHPLSGSEKARMNSLESAEQPNFGTRDTKYADENITNLPERAVNSIKKGYAEMFENLSPSVAVAKEAGVTGAITGGVGAIGGALWGLRKGNPVGGMLEGFGAGVRLGGGAGAMRKSFELEAGFARQELKNMKDKDGKPLPEDLVNNASIGVGIANAGLEALGLETELKTFPGADKVLKQAKKDFLKEVVENEGLRNQLLAAGKNLVKSTATEMATESIQQVSNIVAEEYAKKVGGNYDDKIFEDGKVNQGALRRHIGEIVQAGVSAIGPSMIIGGLGTSMTATNILVKNGMNAVQAKKVAESMSVDERADFINENLDTLDSIAKDHITEVEAQDIEKNFFDKAIEVYKDKDGNVSAEKENQVLSAAKLAGNFAKRFGSNSEQVKDWFNKLSFQNKQLEGGVSMDVPAENAEKSIESSVALPAKDFKQGEIVKDSTSGEVYEILNSDENNAVQLKNVDSGELVTLNADDDSKFSKYKPNENEYAKANEFVYDPKAKDSVNAQNYVDSRPEVIDAHNEYINNPTEENSEKYQEIAGKYSEEYSKIKDDLKNGDKVYFQSAYHGSPHQFDKFSLEHIGNGEGVQAHGYGLYFAANKNVSENYRQVLGGDAIHKIIVDGNTYTRKNDNSLSFIDENNKELSSDIALAESLIRDFGSSKMAQLHCKEIIREAKDDVQLAEVDKNNKISHYEKILDILQNKKIKSVAGQLFEADIPEDNVLLDEDEILQEQNENVQKLVNNLIEKENLKDWYDSLNYDLTGKTLYAKLAKETGSQKAASELLNKYGIKGITYDGHQDGRCYVVFDDKAIDVVKTYYQEKNTEDDFARPKSLDELHKDVAINKKAKEQEYLGYFQEGKDKNIIGIMKDSNESTLVHEMGHLFLQGLNEFAQNDKASQEALAEVNEWLDYEGGDYSVAQQEKFAKGFEAYLYKGQAPTSNLREVFERFKDWLKDIYSHITQIADFSDDEMNKIQNVFDNLFSEKSEKQKQIDSLVEKAKFVGLEKLSDTETRHKDAAYHILSVALGKSPKWLKSILESTSENPKILKQKEKIELSLEHVDDKISGSDGFLPEWGEFFRNPLQWGEANDHQLALEAYNTIVDKTYKQNLDQLGFLDRTEQQYQYLLNQYKNAADRDIPLAAFWTWIDDVEADFQQTYLDKYQKDITYIERFENMDKFEQAKETILKAAYEAGPYMSSVEKYQDVVKAAMKSIKFLTPKDQAKLTANILDIPSIHFLEAQIDSILDIAKTMDDINYKKRLMSEIHKELQYTKNIKRSNKTVGKYDYTTNKVFERMREIEAMSAEQANEIRLEITEAQEENGLSFEDKIVNAYINYKANGLTYTSTEAAKAMYDDIVKMKIAGNDAKSEQDFSAKLNLANDIVEAVRVLDAKTKDASWFEKKYLKTFVNWESALNTLFNEKIMKKYSLLKTERDAKVFSWEKKKKFAQEVAEIYGKSVENFDEPIVDNLKQKFEFYENVEDIENVGSFRKEPKKMNKMELILAYMWDKNEVLHQRLLRQFGDINEDGTVDDLELDRMFNELSDKDKRLGDLMMRSVNDIYPKANEAFIKKYGIDLPRVEHYFPSKVERISEVDLLTDFAMKSTDPSAIKHRSASTKLSMDFGNPIVMMFQHIDSMSKFIHMTETLDAQNKIFKNKTLQKVLENKYDKPVYQEFLRQLTANTYKQQMQNYCEDQKITDAVISNYLIGNISFKPSIAIKQGITAMNYSEVMPALQWAKGFLAAVKDTKGTMELMNKIPYLKARFETGGQNEFLEDEITNSLFAKTGKIKDALTLNVRAGDIFAIAFGGRPYLEYLMKDKGMSEEAAVEEFLNHTQRTMQASETSTLANYQIKARNERGLASLLTAYRNAQAQYIRKAADSIISYSKGEMTKGQMAKTLFIYMYLNPFLYRSATSLSWVTLLATGDSDDLRDDAILSLFDLNADANALWGEIYQFIASVAYKKAVEAATGEKPDYLDFAAKTPLLADIQDQILKIAKDDVSFEDYFKFGGYMTQVGFGIPVNSVYNSIGGVGDIAQGDFLKGALRVQGSSDRAAARASGADEE